MLPASNARAELSFTTVTDGCIYFVFSIFICRLLYYLFAVYNIDTLSGICNFTPLYVVIGSCCGLAVSNAVDTRRLVREEVRRRGVLSLSFR